ncbi:MAG: inositol monophosphatase [Firmicutes bacterium]|nr:inositol monophosphatase [Bacillota bacterium]
MNHLTDLIAPVQQILRDAGQLILDAEHNDLQIERKSAANYVTEIDLDVQHFIVGHLQQLSPEIGIMAEEADMNIAITDRPVWILDPIDGTTNFMHHCQHSSISLALAEGDQLLLGFVYNPFLNEMFIAERGCGATLNGRPIRVSTVDQLAESLLGFGTNPYARARAHESFARAEKVFLNSLELRRCGTCSLDLAYVACGRYDGFFEMLNHPWDFAAGLLLVREAGGYACNWQGQLHAIHTADSMIATNGLIHDALYELVKADPASGL